MSIYERIKEITSENRISIRELEQQLNFANGTINKWKNRAPSDRLLTVAKVLNVSVDYLIGNSNKKAVAELTSNDIDFTYNGEIVSDEDMELVRRVLRGK